MTIEIKINPQQQEKHQMDTITTAVVKQATDLTKQPPRSPYTKLGGYVIMARMIDKGRATIAGTNGDYHFDCPLDNMLLSFKGIKGADVKALLTTQADDTKILEWFNANGTAKTPDEIKTWSESMRKVTLNDNPEKKEFFASECKRLGLDPEKSTLFQMLDADDKASFKK
jgi:hypothetical protein